MILRLKINKIRDVPGCGALSLARVTQTGSRSTNRFFLAAKPIPIKRAHFKMLEQQRGAIFF
jgi:hypothetical protein